jgi:bisphosphoglycerate-dependent phosphoglycerate mutase
VSSPATPTEQARHPADTGGEHIFAVLRERLYGAISCLAKLAALAHYTSADTSAWSRLLDVSVATGGL